MVFKKVPNVRCFCQKRATKDCAQPTGTPAGLAVATKYAGGFQLSKKTTSSSVMASKWGGENRNASRNGFTPRKIYMEHNNGGLEDHFSF